MTPLFPSFHIQLALWLLLDCLLPFMRLAHIQEVIQQWIALMCAAVLWTFVTLEEKRQNCSWTNFSRLTLAVLFLSLFSMSTLQSRVSFRTKPRPLQCNVLWEKSEAWWRTSLFFNCWILFSLICLRICQKHLSKNILLKFVVILYQSTVVSMCAAFDLEACRR